MFPFDKIKFDPNLLANLAVTVKGFAVFFAILELCHSLYIETAAERIETLVQLKQTEGHACGQVQAFLLGLPMPRRGLNNLLGARVLARTMRIFFL